MNLDLWIQGLLGLGLLLFACLFLVGRRPNQRNPDTWKPSRAALGEAFQALQLFSQPQVRHVLAEQQEEEIDEDDNGGPDDPTRHLLRQARRLQRGERLERLMARLPPVEKSRPHRFPRKGV